MIVTEGAMAMACVTWKLEGVFVPDLRVHLVVIMLTNGSIMT